MDDHPVRLLLDHQFLDEPGSVPGDDVLEQQRIVLFIQILRNSRHDFKHVGIFKGHIAMQIRDKQHNAAFLSGKTACPGIGTIVHFFRQR